MNYQRIYDEFIADRKTKEPELFRGASKAARSSRGRRAGLNGFEHHHIKPKLVGGKDDGANIISLNSGDHFFAHLLLAKIHGNAHWRAVWAMAKMDASACNNRFAISGKRRWVAKAREEMRPVIAENTRKQHQDPMFVSRLHSVDSQAKRAATMKLRLAENPQHLLAMRAGAKSESSRKKLSASLKRSWAENYDKYLSTNTFAHNNPMHNPESAEKVRLKVVAYCAQPEVKARKSLAMTGDANPAKRADVREKMSASQKIAYEKDPIKYARCPVVYNGQALSLRAAAAASGTNYLAMLHHVERNNVSHQEAFDHFLATTPESRQAERIKKRCVPVICLDTGKVFDSAKSAAEWANIHPCGITFTAKGRQPKAGGYRWAYTDTMKEAA
jgi:hypothetical protein